MFSFFKKKPPAEPAAPAGSPPSPAPAPAPEAGGGRSVFSPSSWFGNKPSAPTPGPSPLPPAAAPVAPAPAPAPVAPASPGPSVAPQPPAPTPSPAPTPAVPPVVPPAQTPAPAGRDIPSVAPAPVTPPTPPAPTAPPASVATPAPVPVAPPTPVVRPAPPVAAEPAPEPSRQGWLNRLRTGLKKTGSGIQAVFVNAQIDDELYEQLEEALLMADTGIPAAEHILQDLKDRVWRHSATTPQAVRALLVDAVAEVLKPLEKPLEIGRHTPTVIMVAGVNGAGKTTSIGKLTKHLANEGCTVLLAAADTFRAAAREQLAIWADRNLVEIVSQAGGDPSAVAFDAVNAGKARGKDVVLVDTAGRLPTQLHLMDELKKIKRVIGKADTDAAGGVAAPHEVLLVIDGNTGQNALAQVKAFDDALGLTGLVVTKLDGTAKGGVLCAIARWGEERARTKPGTAPVPVYFIGVGEKLEDLETFDAREFAQALVG
ncbi:signal recognition particle-docking protein FtsY [Pseudacidovorax sp. NFM-22]|uniref:signal recognition particle-docking protein FtsY n=1 Tax=Pseudacidovorax sp. NFM-22 TaxID=2744469 RepID=UPI001F4872F2|nr:signal recognition particle-docking protein FtsY [Pseudacidovorax sp. NFM-22]